MSQYDDLAGTVSIERRSSLDVGRASLQVIAGPDAGRRFDIEHSARVGARSMADIVLTDARISGLHCEFTVGRAAAACATLGSKNGTFVGGVQLLDALLAPGDIVTVGEKPLHLSPAGTPRRMPLHDARRLPRLVGQSPSIRALAARLAALAATDTTVLVQGETGTGKERVAEALHLASRRASKPQVVVDCGSMPVDHDRVRALRPRARRPSRAPSPASPAAFERAPRWPPFLDEVGELAARAAAQAPERARSRVVRRLGGQRADHDRRARGLGHQPRPDAGGRYSGRSR